jgi:hypothetical protein
LPASVVGLFPNKARLYESMRRHEIEVKNYLAGKLVSLKEDIIQGSSKCATKRLLAVKATVSSDANEWNIKIFGKLQGEPVDMMEFFDRLKISFTGTEAYQPVDWQKSRCPNPQDFNGVEITRKFPPQTQEQEEKSFSVTFSLTTENSPKRFVLSQALQSILGI